MDDRLLLDKIDYARGVVHLDGQEYPLNDSNFPTIDPADPYALTEEEQGVVDRLRLSFLENDKLQAHVALLFRKGSMYLAFNGNLLYHGCIPMDADGSFQVVTLDGQQVAGKSYLDRIDRLVRQGYLSNDPAQRQFGQDMMWYLWAGPKSPLFGKRKMATFERYFIDDKATHVEERNAYYTFRDQEQTVRRIMEEFGMDPDTSHIVNGHVPVKVRRGESPVKAGGKLLVIDGGFSRAYQRETGIAGYTLIFNSFGLLLAAHEGFEFGADSHRERHRHAKQDADPAGQHASHPRARHRSGPRHPAADRRPAGAARRLPGRRGEAAVNAGLDRWEARWAPYDEGAYAAVLAAIRSDDMVLDIGAGDLRLARRMAERARRVVAWELQAELLAGSKWPENLLAVCTDARTEPVPPGVTVAVLLMRHCTHYGLYVAKLRAAGCRRLITNTRWGMGVEVVDLGPGKPFAAHITGWYACRRCGAVGFAGDDPALVTADALEHVIDFEGCPRCDASTTRLTLQSTQHVHNPCLALLRPTPYSPVPMTHRVNGPVELAKTPSL